MTSDAAAADDGGRGAGDAEAGFERAVAAFRAWAATVTGRHGEWECGYGNWPGMWNTFRELLRSSDPGAWDQRVAELVLYALARDNEMEELKEALVEHPRHLLVLARIGLRSAEWDARWQLAGALGIVRADEEEVVPVLEAYAADANEYVSRIALLALGRRRAPVAEELACRAWETGHEYQRMAALHVLAIVGSPLLSRFLGLAEADGRLPVVSEAEQVRAGGGST